MSEGKHTKGPWLFDGQCITTESGLSVIATVERDQGAGQEATDNARLIAAAPELLEACRRIICLFDDPKTGKAVERAIGTYTLANIRAALAKAEKGQP